MTLQQKIWVGGGTLFKAFKPFFLYIFMPGICMGVGYALRRPDMTIEEFYTYGVNFYATMGMLLALYLMHRRCKKRGTKLVDEATCYLVNPDYKKIGFMMLFGTGAAVAISAVITLFPFEAVTGGYTQASERLYNGHDLFFSILATVIVAPVLEEIVFRGFMLNRLMSFFSEKWSIYIVSGVFALCHGNLLWILYAFFMGLVLAKVSLREDNILYSIVLHIGFNFPSAIACLLTFSPSASSFLFERTVFVAAYGLIGLLAAVMAGKLYLKKFD